MAQREFAKLTKEQRERLRDRRSESRALLRNRLLEETRLVCFLYLGGCNGGLTTAELSFLRRECGDSQTRALPAREALCRKVRSFVMGCRPSLRERRELLAQLLEFALCDGALSTDEEEGLRVIEELLQLSPQARTNGRQAWGATARKATTTKVGGDSKGRTRQSTRERRRGSQPPPPRIHWSYEYLGCSEQDTDETIKRRYRQLAVKLHPDKHAAQATTPEETLSHLRAFQKLQQAYEAILRLRCERVSR